MEQHAEVLIGGEWRQRHPSWRDAIATLLVLAIVILLGSGAHQMLAPFVAAQQPAISLSPSALPFYALRTTMRMLAARGGLLLPSKQRVSTIKPGLNSLYEEKIGQREERNRTQQRCRQWDKPQ